MTNVSKTGGELIAETLAALGTDTVFALHGGHLDAFLVAAPDHGIHIVDTRHEASAGHAAEAYSRVVAPRVGVAVVTAGPGFTNAMTPMTAAYLDAVPVVFMSGSPPLRETETNPLQGGFDQVAMSAPVTKWAHRITHTERIPDLLEKAFRIARQGKPGPVFLEVPIDVMFGPAGHAKPIGSVREIYRPAPAPEAVSQLIQMVRDAKRPVIVAGAGTVLSPTREPLVRFCERAGVPVVTNGKANGVMPHDHPQYCGGTGAVIAMNMSGSPADLVIMAGAKQGLLTGGRSEMLIPHGARLVQIDIAPEEIGRIRNPDLGIMADCAETFASLAAAAGTDWPDFSDWVSGLQAARGLANAMFDQQPATGTGGLLHPYHAARVAIEALDPDTTLVADGGESGAWCSMHMKAPGPGRFMSNGYLGCLGCGPGFAIGAAIAKPGSKVALFSGDGAAGFHLQEFDTMVRHELPILTVVMNNACWGMSQSGQDMVYGANRRSIVALAQSRYDEVAVALGAKGYLITDLDDIAEAVREAQSLDGPSCINIMTDPAISHPVTAAMVGDVNNPDEIAIPYYENIPIR